MEVEGLVDFSVHQMDVIFAKREPVHFWGLFWYYGPTELYKNRGWVN